MSAGTLKYASVLRSQEEAVYKFRSIFEKYGYSQYKMTKFEEYDLYAKNKDFLLSSGIITFTDTNGKLMALKPDVTLSIVKNRGADKSLDKVYYNENVYRVSESTGAYKEIMQVGLECLGDVDDFILLEVLTLAEESLKCISFDYVLSVSNLDIVSKVLEKSKLFGSEKELAISAIASKNLGEINSICQKIDTNDQVKDALRSLVTVYGPLSKIKDKLSVFKLDSDLEKIVDEFIKLLSDKEEVTDGDNTVIDFSVIDNMKYYNGVVFTGNVLGVPSSVLSGGQYDKLMGKMGKESRAIGFAIYLDSITKLSVSEDKLDVDVVVLYDDKIPSLEVLKTVRSIDFLGKSVVALKEIPAKLKYGKMVDIRK